MRAAAMSNNVVDYPEVWEGDKLPVQSQAYQYAR